MEELLEKKEELVKKKEELLQKKKVLKEKKEAISAHETNLNTMNTQGLSQPTVFTTPGDRQSADLAPQATMLGTEELSEPRSGESGHSELQCSMGRKEVANEEEKVGVTIE